MRTTFSSEQIATAKNRPRYKQTVDELVDKAQELYRQQPKGQQLDETVKNITPAFTAYRPKKYANQPKI